MSPEELVQARQMIIRAHRKAVFWKKHRRLVELTIRYARDGSLWPRVRRKYRGWTMRSWAASS
jgi:hypothetical protein